MAVSPHTPYVLTNLASVQRNQRNAHDRDALRARIHRKGPAPLIRKFMADIEDEPLFSLSEADILRLKADKLKIEFALTTHVSEAVRAVCEAEMERGRKSGWKRF